MKDDSICAAILVKNEQKKLSACIKSLTWCDEIIVMDDYSTDDSITILQSEILNKNESSRIRIISRHLEENFGSARNFFLDKTSCDWIFYVDADEIITAQLKNEIIQKIRDRRYSGFLFRRKDFFLGKFLNHGETNHVKLLRLARRGSGKWVGKVHEEWKIKGKFGILNNPILHYPHDDLKNFLSDVNYYTNIVAQYKIEEGKRVSVYEIIFYPLSKFLLNYIFRLGFLDKDQGLIMAAMMSFHSFLVRAKIMLK